MSEVVLDASAILALVFDEPGAERVTAQLPGAAASAVNIAEAASKFGERGMPPKTVEVVIGGLRLEVHLLDLDAAYKIGTLRQPTRAAGLSLGDRACLALAQCLDRPALTTDRAWATVAKAIGVDIQVIR